MRVLIGHFEAFEVAVLEDDSESAEMKGVTGFRRVAWSCGLALSTGFISAPHHQRSSPIDLLRVFNNRLQD